MGLDHLGRETLPTRLADAEQVFDLRSANLVGMRVRRWVLVGAAFAGTAIAALRQRLLAHNERRPETR